ncbi:MAG TPA: sulfatase [Actinomycetota bacterium]|nr:sulfatase [Actinomycetota bacterium]
MQGNGRRLPVPVRALAVILATAAAVLAAQPPIPAQPGPSILPPPVDTRPNVLIFITDDQRADSLNVMPRTRRWFASGGVTFANAYATTPVCCPSRASIMTGRYAHNHRVETNGDVEQLDQRSTLQRYLQEAGYQTAIAGKYLNNWTGNPPHFDRWTIFESKRAGYYGAIYNTGGDTQRVATYSTDYVAAESMRFLRAFEERDDRPWLMYVAPYAPHAPQKPARRHLDTSVPPWRLTPSVRERDRTDKPPWVLGKRLYGENLSRLRNTRAGQLRTLRAADELVNSVMKTLTNLGEDQRTMSFFLSDNGFLWGEHGLKQKQAPYTSSVRIPLLFRWPGHVATGQTLTRPVANIDVVPTVFQAVGVTPAPEYPVDGRSLLTSSRDRILLEFHRRFGRPVPTWASTRTESYQYTEWYGDDGQTVEFREYYNLAADPWQLTNLLADADPSNDPPPDIQAQLSAQLVRDRECVGAPEDSQGSQPPPSGTPSGCP